MDIAFEHIKRSVEFYKKTEVKGSIADVSKLYGSFIKIMDFMVEEYYPAAIKSGIRCAAYVVSKDLMNENLGLKLKQEASKFNINAAVFTSLEKAEKWVRLNS